MTISKLRSILKEKINVINLYSTYDIIHQEGKLSICYFCILMFLYQVHEQCEKESGLLKQLDRLRLHLVAVEESYTQETLKAEEQVKDLQNKLAQAEERLKNSSTAYTSAR